MKESIYHGIFLYNSVMKDNCSGPKKKKMCYEEKKNLSVLPQQQSFPLQFKENIYEKIICISVYSCQRL